MVLSTDIAESSLTVAGVRIVVDAGLARVPRFDTRTGMSRLTTVTTSRASADQRAGRAGRTEPGVCYRLWSKLEQQTRLAHLPAEITQVDLAGFALELAAWNARPGDLAFADPPPAKALDQAHELLVDLEALTVEPLEVESVPELDAAIAALPSGGRLVANAVTLVLAVLPLGSVAMAVTVIPTSPVKLDDICSLALASSAPSGP